MDGVFVINLRLLFRDNVGNHMSSVGELSSARSNFVFHICLKQLLMNRSSSINGLCMFSWSWQAQMSGWTRPTSETRT